MTRLRQLNIAVGNYFFRYRNALFPVLFVLAGLLGRPRLILSDPRVDALLSWCGVPIALLGQAIRLITIGYEYIERGGRAGKVYASHLVHGGVYALTRNPMYLGNALIAVGLTVLAGSPLLYLVVLPFFLFVYQAIVAAEEAYLRRQFGAEYAAYCARVPQWLPAWSRIGPALSGLDYDWRKAVRKELSTLTGLLLGLICLPVLRGYWLRGWQAVHDRAIVSGMGVLVVLLLFPVLAQLKKHRKLFY